MGGQAESTSNEAALGNRRSHWEAPMQTAHQKNDEPKGTSLEIFSGDKMPAFVPSSMRAVSFLVHHHGFLRYDFPR